MLRSGALWKLAGAVLSREVGSSVIAKPSVAWGVSKFTSMPERIEPELPPTHTETERGWGRTKISDVLRMKPDVGAWLFCARDDLVIDAVRKMCRAGVGSLLVFDPSKISLRPARTIPARSDAVVGIITERDYLTKVVVEGKSSSSTMVADIMTPQSKLMTVPPHASVVETMELMATHNVRHVPVVDHNSMLGMVSIKDMVKVIVREHKEDIDTMNSYIQGSY